jgi:hypothetical protein
MRAESQLRQRSVFLNVPFDNRYEPLFLALMASLIALGRTPRCVLEIPEIGQGRLSRIYDLIKSCPVSLHDLSRVGVPVRFNMPFELGIAAALSRGEAAHQFLIMDSKRFQLQKTLSDVNGFDPAIHNGTVRGVISCVLSHFYKSSQNPSPSEVFTLYRKIVQTVPTLKRTHGRSSIYSRAIYYELTGSALLLAVQQGLVKP